MQKNDILIQNTSHKIGIINSPISVKSLICDVIKPNFKHESNNVHCNPKCFQ